MSGSNPSYNLSCSFFFPHPPSCPSRIHCLPALIRRKSHRTTAAGAHCRALPLPSPSPPVTRASTARPAALPAPRSSAPAASPPLPRLRHRRRVLLPLMSRALLHLHHLRPAPDFPRDLLRLRLSRIALTLGFALRRLLRLTSKLLRATSSL
jgi:hypothetical protein